MKNSNDTRQKLIDITYDEIYEKRLSRSLTFRNFIKSTSSQRLYVLLFANKKRWQLCFKRENEKIDLQNDMQLFWYMGQIF